MYSLIHRPGSRNAPDGFHKNNSLHIIQMKMSFFFYSNNQYSTKKPILLMTNSSHKSEFLVFGMSELKLEITASLFKALKYSA